MAKSFAKIDENYYKWWKKLAQDFVVYVVSLPYFKIKHGVEIIGRENIPDPRDGNYIVAANHISNFDPILVSLAMKIPVAYMAKEELFHIPILGKIVQMLGAFAVNRQKLEISTIRSAKAVLTKTNWCLGIFPEGTRIFSNEVGKIQNGFVFLAKSTKSRILPMGIVGSNSKNEKIVIKIGKPFEISEDPEETKHMWGRAISELTGRPYKPEIYENEPKEPETAEC